ncbi:MAG: hypothetical protein KBC43_05300 [Bacteroidales bacterium]|nr:hypothetical protein [Bacteroidales bacterium]
MKKMTIISIMMISAMISEPVKSQTQTNDFYDDAETYDLAGITKIMLDGEIGNPGTVEITDFPLRSLIIKEAVLSGDSNRFTGAYRYDGYSLYDILNLVVLKKKNEAEFPPIIDLYVKVENPKGESVVFSWGEIYYPVHRHEVIIATKVARIMPSKTKDLWPLPTDIKIVAGHDLITGRNISNPVKITVLSANATYPIHKDMSPLFSPEIKIMCDSRQFGQIDPSMDLGLKLTYETIFYGRGRGIHSTMPFHGIPLKDVLKKYFKITDENLKTGYFVVASVDGYRVVFTFSEIFNRNDQAELLLIEDKDNHDGGAFRLFPAADFFSDRAVKGVSEIYLLNSNFSPR